MKYDDDGNIIEPQSLKQTPVECQISLRNTIGYTKRIKMKLKNKNTIIKSGGQIVT